MSYQARFDNEYFQEKIVQYFDNEYGNKFSINYVDLSYRKRYDIDNDNTKNHSIILNYTYQYSDGFTKEYIDLGIGDNYNDALIELITNVYSTIYNESKKNQSEIDIVNNIKGKSYNSISLDEYQTIIDYHVSIEDYEIADKFTKLMNYHHNTENKEQ